MDDLSLQQLLVTNFGLSPSGYAGSRGDTGYVGSGGLGYTGSAGIGYAGSAGVGFAGPRITSIGYPDDDTAANTAGGDTITLTGANFASGALVIINGNAASVVSVVNSTTITFTAPPNPTGSYLLYVVNQDGATTLAVPGLQYSGIPAWTTPSGLLGTIGKGLTFTANLAAAGDAPVTYSVYSGSLPSGITLTANTGVITGTAPDVASDTTYSFTVRATDAQRQDTDRAFSILVQPVVYFAATVDYLLVAGGGGGSRFAGGGGGGILTGSLSPNTLTKTTITYPVVIGAGGLGAYSGTTGGNTTAFSLTAVGGGGAETGAPGAGGSPFVGAGGPSDSQHNAGGTGDGNYIAPTAGGSGGNKAGGGGGGGAYNQNRGADGGAGATFTISGSSITYAGGGGGSQYNVGSGSGGAGGGGAGSSGTGGAGSDGLGGGGGAGYGGTGGSGGSGTAIIRYPDTYPLAASTTGNPTISTTGGYRIYRWTSTGSITF